jgi:hypothetical protein
MKTVDGMAVLGIRLAQWVRSSPRISLVLVLVSNLRRVLQSRGFGIRVSITLV